MADILTEVYVDALHTALSDGTTGVEAKMDLIDTEKDDGITLQTVDNIYKGGHSVITQLPALVIWPEGSTNMEPTTATYGYRDIVVVWTVLKGGTPEETHKRVWRMQRAIFQSVLATTNLSASVDICEYAGRRFDTPWRFGENDALLGIGGVAFQITDEVSP